MGGGLIIFEKVRAAHSKNEEINVGAYNDFKRSNGFSEKEINQKALSLRGKMECYTPEENSKLLGNFFISIKKFTELLNNSKRKNLLKNINELDGIGSAQLKSLEQFFSNKSNSEIILSLVKYLKIENVKILNKN